MDYYKLFEQATMGDTYILDPVLLRAFLPKRIALSYYSYIYIP